MGCRWRLRCRRQCSWGRPRLRTEGRRARRATDDGRGEPDPDGVRPSFDLLNLPRPPARSPWAYVKVAEGCDRRCGFCAIPSFRGPEVPRTARDILDEVEVLGAQEVVLVAQDLVSWDRDLTGRKALAAAVSPGDVGLEEGGGLVALVRAVQERVERVRLLYLYPSGLSEELVEVIGESGCPYYDLSLQHVSGPLLRRMRRSGNGERFVRKISDIRRRFPEATLRSSFIVGYPGETEEDHDALLRFPKRPGWIGSACFLSLSSRAPTPPACMTRSRRSWPQNAYGSVRNFRTPSPPPSERNWWVPPAGRWSMRRAGPGATVRRQRSIGLIRAPRQLAVGSWVELEVVDPSPDLVGVPAGAKKYIGQGTGDGDRLSAGFEAGTLACPPLACNLSAGV